MALALASMLLAVPASSAQIATEGKPTFDSRERSPVQPAAPESAAAIRARDQLGARLGRQGVVSVDPRTGTPRFVGKLDGALTGVSKSDPERIVLDYVRAERGVFGLSDEDIADLRLVRRYRDARGTTHLLWAQTWRGLIAWDNDLRAAVAADGRLINVGGSPAPGIASRSAVPSLSPSQALSEALDDVGGPRVAPEAMPRGGPDRRTTFAGGHEARLVLFTERAGDVHLAWNVTTNAGPAEVYTELIDAHSGRLLYRANRVDSITGQVRAFQRNPGDGSEALRAVEVDGSARLSGPYAHVFANVDGDNTIDPGEEVQANVTGPPPQWTDAFADKCPTNLCSWDRSVPSSWQDNLPHDAQQVYWFVNNFRDHLARPQIGFTGFEGVDLVNAAVMDGANTAGGLPDGSHRNNATMSTPPEGQSPTMRMFLFSNPDRSGGEDATVVYHEYTHGLSNRLITRPDGEGALDAHQAASMGEGWSDWYALDKLVADTPALDTGAPGEVTVGGYATGAATGVRSKALDCPVGVAAAKCGGGGFTYGDLGRLTSIGPEVHADGEIWAQTLWDLRNVVGSDLAQELITGGMRLAPDDPSMLEARNAILQADLAAPHNGAHQSSIWSVFAGRGMGYFAVSQGPNDVRPRPSFATPPAGPGGTVSGRVTEQRTGRPVQGALVQFGSSAFGFPGDFTGVTDADGNYSIANTPAGTYAAVLVDAAGHSPAMLADVTVGAGGRRLDAQVLRDWAASSGGASIAAFDQPNFGPSGCGPNELVDRRYTTVWGSTAGTPKSVTVRLPEPIDIAGFAIDPGAGCGDDDTASTAGFRVETSTDGQVFVAAAAGTFTSADNHRPNVVTPTAGAGGVRFVRYTMLTPQSTIAAGRDFLDTAELEVFGAPTPAPAPPATTAAVQPTVPLPTRDLIAPVGRLGLVARQKLRTALSKGMKLTVECNEPCSANLAATLDAKTAKKLKLLPRRSRAKTVRVASGKLATGSGKRTATLKFTSKARKLLKRQKKLKLAVSAEFADASGNKSSRKLGVSLKR